MHDLSELHITTPITYGGGIDNHHQAAAIVKLGAERICIGPTKSQDESLITSISESLGEQSIVMHIPLRVNSDGNLSDALEVRALNKINNFLPARWGGEILLTNVSGDGATHANVRGLTKASECVSQKAKVILSGGFNTIEEISAAYSSPAVSAVAIGNMLHRVEVPVLKIKSKLSMLLRPRGEK
jgi:imidazole glycerol phosphate synthase subunit HisF